MLVFSRFTGFLVIALLAGLLCLLFGTFLERTKRGMDFQFNLFATSNPRYITLTSISSSISNISLILLCIFRAKEIISGPVASP